MATEKRERAATAMEQATLDSLGQLREILFGAIQRDLERRLGRIDAHLAAKAHELEQESRRRTEVVEAHLRKETEALVARFERESADRSEAYRAMTREHRESLSNTEQRLAKLEDALIASQRELRHQLLDQAKSFLDEVQRIRHEVSETLERELGLSESELSQVSGDEREGPPAP